MYSIGIHTDRGRARYLNSYLKCVLFLYDIFYTSHALSPVRFSSRRKWFGEIEERGKEVEKEKKMGCRADGFPRRLFLLAFRSWLQPSRGTTLREKKGTPLRETRRTNTGNIEEKSPTRFEKEILYIYLSIDKESNFEAVIIVLNNSIYAANTYVAVVSLILIFLKRKRLKS